MVRSGPGSRAPAERRQPQEIGIRMALGARAPDILSMVLRRGMRLAWLGILLGVAAGDPATFTVTLILLVVALVARWTRARRAATVGSTPTLRRG